MCIFSFLRYPLSLIVNHNGLQHPKGKLFTRILQNAGFKPCNRFLFRQNPASLPVFLPAARSIEAANRLNGLNTGMSCDFGFTPQDYLGFF
jgi:hypothetical protein